MLTLLASTSSWSIHLLSQCTDGAPLLRASHEPPISYVIRTSSTPYRAVHVAGLVPVGAVNGYEQPMVLGESSQLYIYKRSGVALA